MDLEQLCYSLAKHITKQQKKKDGERGLLPEDYEMFSRAQLQWKTHEKQVAEVRRKMREVGAVKTIYSDPNWKPSITPVKYRYDENGKLVVDDGTPLPKKPKTEDIDKLSKAFGGLFNGLS
jgi:hypothetical protein